jgi:gliding motility-associated-like protein
MSIEPINNGCGNSNLLIFYGAKGGTPPYTYSLDGINYALPTTDGYDFLPPGHYTVFIKDANGVITSYSYDFPKNCSVAADLQGASCGQKDGSITVTNNNGIAPFTYSIDGNNFQTSNVFTGLAAGYYSVISKDVNGATEAGSFRVTSGCPVVTATITIENCLQKNGIINAIGSGGNPPYTFSIDGLNFQANNIFTGLSAGTYTVTIMDASGFTSTTSAQVQNDCMVLSVDPSNATCGNNNGQIVINVSSGMAPYIYSLDGVNFQSLNTFANLSPGTYSVTVRDLAGTQSSDIAKIGNIAGPQMMAISQNADCSGNDGIIDINESGGTTPFNYSIDGVNFQPSPHFGGLPVGTIMASVKDGNGCMASQSVNILLTDNLFINQGIIPAICEGKREMLNLNSNGTSFSWSPITGLDNPAALNPVASPKVTTEYMITAINGVCNQTATISVVVYPAPVADAGADKTICYGQSSQLNGTGGVTFNWTPSEYLDDPTISNPNVLHPTNNISYHLTTTDANSCQSLNDATVNIYVTPPAKVFAGNDTSVLINQYIQLQALDINNTGFDQYQWTPSLGLNSANISNPVAMITQDVTYSVSASTSTGCEGTATISIKAYSVSDIFVPNGFTPNGDGHNDILKALPIGIRELQYFRIYNRWGQMIFQTTNASTGWDGLINGELQPTGTYVWMAAGINYQGRLILRKGTVVLIR